MKIEVGDTVLIETKVTKITETSPRVIWVRDRDRLYAPFDPSSVKSVVPRPIEVGDRVVISSETTMVNGFPLSTVYTVVYVYKNEASSAYDCLHVECEGSAPRPVFRNKCERIDK